MMDREVLVAAKEGDKEALGHLLQQIRPALHSFALHKVGYGEQAEDAVQETCFIILTKIHQLRNPDAFKQWAFSILANQCKMQWRKDSFEKCYSEMAFPPDAKVRQSIDQHLNQLPDQAGISKKLDCLSEKLRPVVLLRYFSDFNSYWEIAHILDVPIGTVRSRLSASRNMLRKELAQEEISGYSPLMQNHYGERVRLFKEGWNAFYNGKRQDFLKLFDRELHLRFSSGKNRHGIKRWEKEWIVDFDYGVRFLPNYVISSGNISLVEGPFKKLKNGRDQCPPAGAFVFFHDDEIVKKVHLHYPPRRKQDA